MDGTGWHWVAWMGTDVVVVGYSTSKLCTSVSLSYWTKSVWRVRELMMAGRVACQYSVSEYLSQ